MNKEREPAKTHRDQEVLKEVGFQMLKDGILGGLIGFGGGFGLKRYLVAKSMFSPSLLVHKTFVPVFVTLGFLTGVNFHDADTEEKWKKLNTPYAKYQLRRREEKEEKKQRMIHKSCTDRFIMMISDRRDNRDRRNR